MENLLFLAIDELMTYTQLESMKSNKLNSVAVAKKKNS